MIKCWPVYHIYHHRPRIHQHHIIHRGVKHLIHYKLATVSIVCVTIGGTIVPFIPNLNGEQGAIVQPLISNEALYPLPNEFFNAPIFNEALNSPLGVFPLESPITPIGLSNSPPIPANNNVPEPSTIAIFCGAILALFGIRRLKRI